MLIKKTFKEAEKYGIKNYLTPEYTETIHGNWEVKEGYGLEIKETGDGVKNVK